jgi:magnesium-transporting ATPase (P-type)
MPYMLELAAIISLAVQDYADFGIIIAMLICNGVLGFEEQRKAAESLVSEQILPENLTRRTNYMVAERVNEQDGAEDPSLA